MSDTPRTDAAEQEFVKIHGLSAFGVALLARQLERELSARETESKLAASAMLKLQGEFDKVRNELQAMREKGTK